MKPSSRRPPIDLTSNSYTDIIKKLKDYRMFQQISYESIFSEQSSDINPIRQASKIQFSSAEEQIINVKLYDDIPGKLLLEPEEKSISATHNLFKRNNGFYVFDSLVVDQELHQKEIQLLRKKQFLEAEVQSKRASKQAKSNELIKLRGQNLARKNAQTLVDKIYQTLDVKAPKLKKQIDHKKWFQDLEKLKSTRKQAISQVMKRQAKQKQTLEQEIQNLDQQMLQMEQTLKEKNELLEQTMQKIANKRYELKQKCIENCIRKEMTEIYNLKNMIKNMEQTLSNRSSR